ncbi:MAG TPA: hypothetical protein EYN91_03270 [Candidatus Melainabacteria bacterium]|jgi:hypothetical protein|nr:hypothetical protein [Candidatus Melainabacteria bacterium]HIN64698.1 hypothetical protein [Candidatus Obscuribacterales bacterium]
MTQNEGNNTPEKMLLKGKVEITKAPEDHLEHSVDAKQARESTRADQQRAQEANKDRHSGSESQLQRTETRFQTIISRVEVFRLTHQL